MSEDNQNGREDAHNARGVVLSKPFPKGPELIIAQADIDVGMGSGELMPCPFCGGKATSVGEKTPNGFGVCYKIRCTRTQQSSLWPACTASVWWTDGSQEVARKEAVRLWNRRFPATGKP